MRHAASGTTWSSRWCRPRATCPTPCSTASDRPWSSRSRTTRALGGLRERIGADRVLVTGSGHRVDSRAAVAALADRGLRHVLAEGGPSLLARLVDADVVDEVCLTWTPQLVGGPASRILDQPSWLSPARSLVPLHLLHADGVLLGRWRVTRLGA